MKRKTRNIMPRDIESGMIILTPDDISAEVIKIEKDGEYTEWYKLVIHSGILGTQECMCRGQKTIMAI